MRPLGQAGQEPHAAECLLCQAAACGSEGVLSPSAPAAGVAAVGGRMEPASGKLLETLGLERDCATGAVGDPFPPATVQGTVLGLPRCESSPAGLCGEK